MIGRGPLTRTRQANASRPAPSENPRCLCVFVRVRACMCGAGVAVKEGGRAGTCTEKTLDSVGVCVEGERGNEDRTWIVRPPGAA